MGSPIEDKLSKAYREEEKPQHERAVEEFAIARFLVTAEEFCLFLNDVGNDGYWIDKALPLVDEPSTITKVQNRFVPQTAAERCPATMVTWGGADAYTKWLAKKTGLPIRLPTEAEWELAARGRELRAWPWGNDRPFFVEDERPLLPIFLGDGAVKIIYRDTLKGREIGFYHFYSEGAPSDAWYDPAKPWPRSPVGSFPRNATPEGVYDMWGYSYGQWCSDAYDSKAYSRKDGGAATPIAADTPRVMRGTTSVPISGPLLAKQDLLLLRLILPMGDARWDLDTWGRTWSRIGGHPTKGNGLVRIAMSLSVPNATQGRSRQ
jgi:formylglycine-generating enzyme required for sulfatase activity